MARFESIDLDKGVDLVSGGFGPLGGDLSSRSTTPNPDESITFANAELVITVPQFHVTLKYTGEGLSYNGSGDLYGLSGVFHREEMFVGGVSRYILSDFDISPVDFFIYSTWESVFSGNDQIYLSNQDDHVTAGSGNDIVEAGRGFDQIWAGSGNDYVQGGFNGDRLYGEEGNDDLRGGNGLDLIVGGVGNDTIRGAKGTDTLTGGDGADVFIFEKELDGVINVDTITDFVSGADQIQLSASVFTAFSGQVGQNIGLNQKITYNAASGILSYDGNGAGSGAAVAFAVLGAESHPTSVGTDFWIVA